MDMDVLVDSPPISRNTSPPPVKSNDAIEEEQEDVVDRAVSPSLPVKTEIKNPEPTEEVPKKMGNLMKELKQDVTQGAMEFNMDSFF